MKYKKLFTALLAAAAMLTACKQEKDYTLPEIKVNVLGLDFEAASSRLFPYQICICPFQ